MSFIINSSKSLINYPSIISKYQFMQDMDIHGIAKEYNALSVDSKEITDSYYLIINKICKISQEYGEEVEAFMESAPKLVAIIQSLFPSAAL